MTPEQERMEEETGPKLVRVLETVLYYASEQEEDVMRFYREVLGLRQVAEFSFRVGDGVLLLFDAQEAATKKRPPPHGASGSVHTCFVAPADQYEAWKERLARQGVPTIDEITWGSGVRSFYFHDPAGNVLEIAEGDLWPR